jgi:hypothetical protein
MAESEEESMNKYIKKKKKNERKERVGCFAIPVGAGDVS